MIQIVITVKAVPTPVGHAVCIEAEDSGSAPVHAPEVRARDGLMEAIKVYGESLMQAHKNGFMVESKSPPPAGS